MLWAIVDAGGLSQGAQRLGKSQPSLSRSLATLEARLGAPLFEKGRRPLKPTELCLTLAREGQAIAEATQSAARAATRHRTGETGTLRLGGTPIFMDGVISPMIAGFQGEFPDISVDQRDGYLERLIEDLRDGVIDLAICPIRPAAVPAGFSFRALLQGRNVIASSAAHPLARKTSLKLDDIAPYPWIAPQTQSPLYRDMRRVLDEIGMTDIRISFSGGSLTSVMNVLAGSEALTVLPQSVLYMQRQARALHALPIRIPHPQRELGILTADASPAKPARRRLEKSLIAQFDGLASSIASAERRSVWKA